MANPVCTTDTLSEINPGFGFQGLNPRQYEAAMIYFMVLELAANGGTNYASAMNTTLISDTVSFIGQADPNQRRIAWLNVVRNNAISAGATVPSEALWKTINSLTGCCFQNESVDMDAVMLFLTCKLGRHADYPQ